MKLRTLTIVAIGALTLAGCSAEVDPEGTTPDDSPTVEQSQAPTESNAPEEAPAEETPAEEAPADDVPAEHAAALASAQSYIEMSGFSKAGLFDQLTSEYGEQFPEDAAQYAVDNLDVDWNEQALRSAESYREMDMSNAAIADQLASEFGEQFTQEQADYAVAHLDD